MKKRSRKANAEPSGGGGGGGWKEMNEKLAANRAKLQGGGLAIKTASWVNGKIESGDIEGGMSSEQTGTSIFDPVLTELCYRWFCPPGGSILDPFAGGSVRGVVASKLGRAYSGFDLRPEQVEANRAQSKKICVKPLPKWTVGDSRIAEFGKDHDFLFSCPPYADLEVYSEDPRDISTMGYSDFLIAYRLIIQRACRALAKDRFAVFVVGDARDRDGFYYGLPWHTVQAFQDSGLKLYNEAVLVTACGSLPIRARKQFESGRKFGKTHQNILCFCKGDPRKATATIGTVEAGDIGDAIAASQNPVAGLAGVEELA